MNSTDNLKNHTKLKKTAPTPHDYFVQSTLSNVKIARDFFKHHLPPEILAITDLKKLTPCPRTFISKRFKKYEADVLYQVNFNGKKGYLYLLIEAQSTIDAMLPFRLFCYIVEIMRYHTEKLKKSKKIRKSQKQQLPLVYPLVLYSGQKKYTGPRAFPALFNGHEDLIKQVLTGPFSLIDLTKMSDADLKDHPYAGLVEFALKYAKTKEFIKQLREHMVEIQAWFDRMGLPVFQNVLNYLVQVLSDTQLDELESILEEDGLDEVKQTLMGTIAKKWEKMGIEKEKVTVATKLLIEGVELVFIAKITGLSLSKIKELQKISPDLQI